jgi:hypothetical protein
MTIDGRYHDATPPWLSIHKRWLENKRQSNNIRGNGHNGKVLVLMAEDGEVLTFISRDDAAETLGVSTAHISGTVKMMRGRDNKCGTIAKKRYKLIE